MDEIDSVFGKENNSKVNITDEDLKKLNYCHMFINEVLRHHSPA